MHQFQDVYIAGHFAVSAIIPLFILLYHKLPKFNLFLIACLGLSGIIIGYCNFIRIYSGGGAFLFVLLWIFLNRNLLKLQKVACALILLFFTFLPYLHFDLLKTNRDRFLNQQFAYKEITSKHPTWHSVYLGLTYLSNKHVEANDDIIADKAAKIVNPNVVYCSDEYDQILKNQVFSIIKKDPLFILKTVAVKAIVLCVMVSIYANFGLLYSFFVKRSIIDLLPFLGAACFYALPGILVFPSRRYVLGMVSISIVFGIYMIGLGLEKYCKSSYKNFVTKHSRA